MSEVAPELSIVVPFFNEEANVAALVAEIQAVAEEHQWRVEMIAVDDGSRDGTAAALSECAATWPALRVISFPRNRGQAAALWEGLHAARAPLVATLDGDGQNVPGDLPALRALVGECDLVVGWRAERNDTALRRVMSRFANAVRGRFLGDRLHDSGCALKVMRREVVESLLPIKSLYSFIPAMAVAAGFKVRELPVRHRERRHGNSSYGLGVMWWRPCMDMLALKWVLARRIR